MRRTNTSVPNARSPHAHRVSTRMSHKHRIHMRRAHARHITGLMLECHKHVTYTYFTTLRHTSLPRKQQTRKRRVHRRTYVFALYTRASCTHTLRHVYAHHTSVTCKTPRT
ncbi:hypothetical protein LOAG_12159 [Loa loa]|uniref:Uncharacterized protein n=1 Tax=Loa loa TaxID=7209 RepID=A0A1S0TLQ9_LOALO|nr:hypothetical protein LOAG_12159 [Loa loa]EFO16347.1 hypothetical protein LOAG_12159 [Loa loa]